MPPGTSQIHLIAGGETPDEVVVGFAAALRAGDAGRAASLFARDGCYVTPDSTVIRGRSLIRGLLQQLVGMVGELTIEQRSILTAGDVAVSSESWSMRSGRWQTVRRVSRSTIVLGRVEGMWRIAVFDSRHGS